MSQFRLPNLIGQYITLSLMVILLLTACAEIPTHQNAIDSLEKAPVCCQSMSEFHYAPFTAATSKWVSLDGTSPAFNFDSGKSYFAAFELPEQALPYWIGLDSRTIGVNEAESHVFKPTLAILDKNYRALKTTDRDTFTFTSSGKLFGLDLGYIYEGAIVVDDPWSKYLLIYTTEQDLAGAVSYPVQNYIQTIMQIGWLFPWGKRLESFEHSPYGKLKLKTASVYAADLSKFNKFGTPADEERYKGKWFTIRPPRPSGYRFVDRSTDHYGYTVSYLSFAKAESSGAMSVAFAQSYEVGTVYGDMDGEQALTLEVKNAVAEHQETFKDLSYTQSEMEIKGASCRRIDLTGKARNPLLMITLPIKGYDIFCIHPQWKYPSPLLLVRIGANYAYAYGESTDRFPDEITTFYNNIHFDSSGELLHDVEPARRAALENLEHAKSAYKRGDMEASYRLLEDGLIYEKDEIRSQYLEYLEKHPEILRSAQKTFSIESFEKTISNHGRKKAKEIEEKRLQIYKTVATDARYFNALDNYHLVFH